MYTKLHRRPPAEADIQAYFRVTPPSVHNMIVTLERRGLITREPGTARRFAFLLMRRCSHRSSDRYEKTNPAPADDMRAEYDFASMKGGVRGKYVRRTRASTNIVLIEPEVSDAFPTEQAVNEALKGVLNTTRAVRSTGGLPDRALQPTSHAKRKAKSRRPSRAARG